MHHGPQKGTAPETAARSQDKCSRTPAEPLPTVHPDKLQAILDSAIAAEVTLPTDRGLPGPYNGHSYDGLYLLKGGGPKVWRLFPRIQKEWRKPQGIIFGKRCGTTQNIGPATRHQIAETHEYELDLVERARRLREVV
jgi:hypothetical protein